MRCKVFGLNQLPFLAGLTAAQKQVIVKAMEVLPALAHVFILVGVSTWWKWRKKVKHYGAGEQVSVDVQPKPEFVSLDAIRPSEFFSRSFSEVCHGL